MAVGQWNGTFTKPVLYADYADPDIIRVGSDFCMASTTFVGSPGINLCCLTRINMSGGGVRGRGCGGGGAIDADRGAAVAVEATDDGQVARLT